MQTDGSIGTVKFYKREFGYGFILPKGGGTDMYFREAALKGEPVPTRGDSVVYLPGRQEDGRPCASHVKIFSRNRTLDGRPYFGKPTKLKDEEANTRYSGLLLGGLAGMFLGPFGAVVGAIIGGAIQGDEYKTWRVEGK